MEWKHVVLEPFEDEPDGVTLEYDRLEAGLFAIEILYLEDGKFFVEQNDGNEEIIGCADTLEEARQLARRWLVDQAADLLAAAGADGVLQLRGVHEADVYYLPTDEAVGLDPIWQKLSLSPPLAMVLIARFPTGDGREPGIEQR